MTRPRPRAIQTPTLILSAGSDWVVRLDAQRQFFDRLSSPIKEMEVYSGLFHAIFHEHGRDVPIARMREFITRRLSEPVAAPSLIAADALGHTKAEHDRLRAPGGRR